MVKKSSPKKSISHSKSRSPKRSKSRSPKRSSRSPKRSSRSPTRKHTPDLPTISTITIPIKGGLKVNPTPDFWKTKKFHNLMLELIDMALSPSLYSDPIKATNLRITKTEAVFDVRNVSKTTLKKIQSEIKRIMKNYIVT